KVLASPTFEDSKGRILIAHAFGHMAHGNSKLVRLYESRFDTAGHRGRILLLRALRVCADDATVKLLEKWARHPAYAEQRPDIGATRAFLADPKRKQPRDRPARTPTDLDLNWADFLVTGEYPPIARILGALEQPRHLREKLAKRLKSPFAGPVKRQDVLKCLDDLKLLKPGSADALVPGDLELLMLYDRKGRLKGDGLVLQVAAQDTLDLADKELVDAFVLHGAASWSLQANLQQHPRLAELLKKHY